MTSVMEFEPRIQDFESYISDLSNIFFKASSDRGKKTSNLIDDRASHTSKTVFTGNTVTDGSKVSADQIRNEHTSSPTNITNNYDQRTICYIL